MRKMCLCYLLLWSFLAHGALQQYQYGKGNVKPGTTLDSPLKMAQLFGERCSGTSFFTTLLDENCRIQPICTYGHKHFPCWFDYAYDEAFYQRPLCEYTLEDSNEVLFLVIYRNPYDWLRSFHEKPYCAVTLIRQLDFSKFIRTPWIIDSDCNPWPPLDTNPVDKQPFQNVIHLRTAKLKNMLRLQDLVKHAYFISYETLYEHPQEVLQEIHEIFGVSLNETFVNPNCHFHGGVCTPKIFKGSQYQPISAEDMDYINETLDEELENSIGYSLVKEL